MAARWGLAQRNAVLSALYTSIGASPVLVFRTGARPATIDAAESGVALVSCTLPATWRGSATNGSMPKAGVWTGNAVATGTIGHYRLMVGSVCVEDGTVTVTGGGGDIEVDSVTVAEIGQSVTVSAHTWAA